jgi:hypothetical protein
MLALGHTSNSLNERLAFQIQSIQVDLRVKRRSICPTMQPLESLRL